MKIAYINNFEEEWYCYKQIKSRNHLVRLGVIWDRLPLISNLSVLENIMLPLSYHERVKIMGKIDDVKHELKNHGFGDSLHERKENLSVYQIFITKYLQALFYKPAFFVFIAPMRIFAGEDEKSYFAFLAQHGSENFLILDYNGYENKYDNNIDYQKVGFDEWLIQDLKV